MLMRKSLLAAALTATFAATAAHAQPATQRWLVLNHGTDAGELVVTSRGDSATARWVYTDRQRGTRTEARYAMGTNGLPVSAEARPVLTDGSTGPVNESIALTGDSLRFTSLGMTRTIARTATDFVRLRGGTPWEQAALARALITRPTRSAKLNGNATVRAQIVADTLLRANGATQRVRLVMVTTDSSALPTGTWLDERGQLFATEVQWFMTVQPRAVPFMPAMRTIELRWRMAEAKKLADKVTTPHKGTVVFRNGNLFDADKGVLVPNTTVVTRNDRIISVGPAASVATPDGATVIDATGKTIMPGMWEMHAHLFAAPFGVAQLSQGLTTARDLASDPDLAVMLRDSEKKGALAAPRYILAGFMEGPLKWRGPSGSLVSTEAQAREWVARYDSLGYKQIKVYNVVHPDLLPTIASEAKKRGMRLSGHIPRGMSMEAAIALGYDEIQHGAFFFSNFFQDSLYVPQMRAYSSVAFAVSPTFDVNGAPMTKLLETLKAKNTVVDGTFSLWIGNMGITDNAARLQSDSAYVTLIRRMHDLGIQMVPGTDEARSATYPRELQMFEAAGIPRAKILQMATIESARVMNDARDYGSVAEGKVADVLLVNGNPLERLSDLSKLETVMRGGRLYDAAKLKRIVMQLGSIGAASAHGEEDPRFYHPH
jgi:imidazolonepropionase-like amidohydrolase